MCDRRNIAEATSATGAASATRATGAIGRAVLFDGSFDGFLCIIHAFYYRKLVPIHIQTEDAYQQTLDTEECYIASEPALAEQVLGGLRKKISRDTEYILYNAFLADEDDKYMDMFRYVVYGFKVGTGLDNHMQQDFVMRVHRLARYVGHEAHMLTGFCRFSKTSDGVFYCAVSPKNNVLPILAEHFRDRFMNQAWVIHDKKHGLAAVYNGNEYVIEAVPKDAKVTYSDEEEHIQDLWVTFMEAISIKERKNAKLQRQHIPLYFREHMTEFQKRLLREF